jgi:hypothetical protein
MITAIEQMRNNNALGQVVFEKLFQLNSKQIKAKLREVIDSEFINDYLLKDGSVQKIILDDEPHKILIHFHDELSINAYGVTFYPEHQKPGKTLIHFYPNNPFKFE